jgi:uncharacterized protein
MTGCLVSSNGSVDHEECLEKEMAAEWTIMPVLVVIFIATLIRSAFGFGEALVAVPLLALFMPVEEAVPLATLVSITVASIVVVQDWHKVHVRSAGWLVISTCSASHWACCC